MPAARTAKSTRRARAPAVAAPAAAPVVIASADRVVEREPCGAGADLTLGEELTIREAAERRAQLLLLLEAGRERIDASTLRTVDTAGLQLLLAASLSAQGRGRRLKIMGAAGLMQSAAALGLAQQLRAAAEVMS